MRNLRRVTRLELDFRDYEFLSLEMNARQDGLISLQGTAPPIWTCHSLKIRTCAVWRVDGELADGREHYDAPTQERFAKVMEGCDNIDTLFDKESLTEEYIEKAPLYIPCIDLVIEIHS